MSNWTLADIRQKVRKVTGRLSAQELTNQQVDTYINQYYQYTFPADVKLNKKLVYYKFTTSANQAYYDFPSGYTNFMPPASANYLNMLFYQDPAIFLYQNRMLVTQLYPWTGDGTTTTFSTVVQAFPIFPGTTIISDNLENFTDNNQTWTTSNVTVTGTDGGTATINYSTGAVSVSFMTAPISGQVINLTYVLFQPGRPVSILMFNNQFQLFPVPDTAYSILMSAYKVPDALVVATDEPALVEWGPSIAYGAARNIVADFGEMDSYMEITALYKEQIAYILSRTEMDLMNSRSLPQF